MGPPILWGKKSKSEWVVVDGDICSGLVITQDDVYVIWKEVGELMG